MMRQRKRSRRCQALAVGAVVVAAFVAMAPVASHAGDLRGVRTEPLRSDLYGLQTRVERAPRASVYDLEQLQRRLAEQRVETPGDPRLDRLELQRRHEQWRAERILRQAALAADRARLEAVRDQLAPPDDLRAPTDLDIRGTALPIGTGKRFLFVQTGLRDARASLDLGRPAVAAEQLAQADAELRALKTVWAGDPNLNALEAEIAALKKRIAASG
jgi:hypothetical protein